MPLAQRPSESQAGRVARAAAVAFEPLESRTLFSGTPVDAVDATTVTTDSTVDVTATDLRTNNGGGGGKLGIHFHGKFRWV